MMRYWENPSKPQARLKGQERKAAVHFFPFSVVGIIGTTRGKWTHRALTWTLCELYALFRDMFGRPCEAGGSSTHLVKRLCERMTAWLNDDFRAMFSDAQRPKLRKILAHLIDEFTLRGNVKDSSTSLNEALHKFIKQAWLRTNHRPDEFALQLTPAEQVSCLMVGELHSEQKASSSNQRLARRNSSNPRDDGVDTGRPKGRSVTDDGPLSFG